MLFFPLSAPPLLLNWFDTSSCSASFFLTYRTDVMQVKTPLSRRKQKIGEVKRIINCILENGAYSNKNEQNQMVKKGDNYNPKEKVLVRMSWRYRNFLGRQMQDALIEQFKNDTEFLTDLKDNDPELYKTFLAMADLHTKDN